MAMNVAAPLPFLLRATYSALFVGQFLPAGVGVDSARIALLWQARVPVALAIGSILLDRLAGLTAIVTLTLIGLPFLPDLLPEGAIEIFLGTLIVAGLVAAASPLVFQAASVNRWPRLSRSLRHIASVRRALFRLPMLSALGYALLIHVLSISSILLLARGFGHSVHFWQFLSVSAVALFLSLLPVSFNGWGVREGALMVGFSLLNVPGESAILISLFYGVLLAIVSLPGCLLLKFAGAKAGT